MSLLLNFTRHEKRFPCFFLGWILANMVTPMSFLVMFVDYGDYLYAKKGRGGIRPEKATKNIIFLPSVPRLFKGRWSEKLKLFLVLKMASKKRETKPDMLIAFNYHKSKRDSSRWMNDAHHCDNCWPELFLRFLIHVKLLLENPPKLSRIKFLAFWWPLKIRRLN